MNIATNSSRPTIPTLRAKETIGGTSNRTNPSVDSYEPGTDFNPTSGDYAKGLGVIALMAAPMVAGAALAGAGLVSAGVGAAVGVVCGHLLDGVQTSAHAPEEKTHSGLVTLAVAGATWPIAIAACAATAGFAALATILDI